MISQNDVPSPKKKHLSLIYYGVLLLIAIVGVLIWFFNFRIDESELTKLANSIQEDDVINKDHYFITTFISKDDNKEIFEHEKDKVYPYKLISTAAENFTSLSNSEKQDIVGEIADKINIETDGTSLIKCGRNKYCEIQTIYITTNSGNLEMYTYEINTSKLEYSYDDKNGDFQTETISPSAYSDSNSNDSSDSTTSQVEPLTLEETSCNRDSGYIYAKGYVKNNSDQTLSFIQIQANFNDASGNIVDTNYTYAVGSEGLAPYSRKSYEIMAPDQSTITDCKYNIVDYQ